MFDLWQVQIGIISLLALAGIIAVTRYPRLRRYLPMLSWLLRIVRVSLDHWAARKVYKDTAAVMARYSTLLDVYSQRPELFKSNRWFSKFVYDTHTQVLATGAKKEDAIRISNAVYSLLTHQQELLDIIRSLDDIKQLDVKRATLIIIDFLGEFFDMGARLDRIFYQDVVYGVNTILLQIKNNPLNKKTISRISSTSWRLYQLTRAYKESGSLSALTALEYQGKIKSAITGLVGSFLGK